MEFKPVATGFCLLEAPRVDARGVWFSEIVLGGIRCLRRDGRTDAWLGNRKLIGGIAMNEDGLLLCSGPGGLIWLNPETGATGTLLDTIDGQPIGGINDILPDGKGGLYFGIVDHPAILEGKPSFGPSAFYHLDADGRVALIRDGLKFANGIGISPDGRHLYHNDSSVGTYVYELSDDGSVGKGTLLCRQEDCDGLAVDCEGGVWIAGMTSGTITRMTPHGRVDWSVPVPGGHVTSLCFGGDGRDLYVTTAAPGAGEAVLERRIPESRAATLYHARTDVPGVPVGLTRFTIAAL